MAGQLLPWIDSGDAEGNRNSMQNFLLDGIDNSFDFNFAGGYIDVSHVKAYIYHTASGITEAIDPVVLTGPNTIQIDPTGLAGDYLVVYRDTPKDQPLIDYSTGAVLDELNLDTANKQAVFATAEMSDRFDAINASSADAIERSFTALTIANQADDKSDIAIADSAAAVITADAAEVTAANALQVAEDAVAAAVGFQTNLEFYTGNDTTSRGADWQTGTVAAPGIQRWFAGTDTASDFTIDRYNDAGVLQGSAVKVDRQTGLVTIETDLTVTGQLGMTSGKIVNLANGDAPADAVNKGQLDSSEAAAIAGAQATSLQKAANLSDLTSRSVATGNLGLGAAAVTGRRNLWLNSCLSVWQRGNGPFTSSGPTADRMWLHRAVATASVSRVPAIDNSAFRLTWSGGGGAGSQVGFWQSIEYVGIFTGKLITVSFEAKADSAGTKLSSHFDVVYGAGGSAYEGPQGIVETTLTTQYVRYSRTFQVADITGKSFGTDPFFRPAFFVDNDTLGTTRQASGAVNIRRIQVEFGGVPSDFEYVTPQDELFDCQWYFSSSDYVSTFQANENRYRTFTLPRTMRKTPALSLVSPPAGFVAGAATKNVASVIYNGGSNTNATVTVVADADLF